MQWMATMPPQHPVARKATIKKARADFKSRGQPTISASERKQIQRGADLERRAWGIEQREKKKAEAALLKKLERERREKEDRARVQMGTQMRCDRFGYKSSQFHLGKFFGAARNVKEEEGFGVVGVVDEQEDDDIFNDDGVDDDTLLEALKSPDSKRHPQPCQPEDGKKEISQPVLGTTTRDTAPIIVHACDDAMQDFWDELGSSTQIARELADDSPQPEHQLKVCQTPLLRPDIIEKHGCATFNVVQAVGSGTHKSPRDLMPPPPLPLRSNKPSVTKRAIQAHPRTSFDQPPTAVAMSGFTMSELEAFVDDDLQLTQMPPG